MMANPEMSSTREQGLAAVPPQGGPVDSAAAAAAAALSEPSPESGPNPKPFPESETSLESEQSSEPEQSSESEAPPRRSKASAAYEPDTERMPLMARVLLADLAVAVVALVVLFVIEVQRFGDASLHLRRQAWGEDLVVLFGVTAVFGAVAYLLIRARHARVAIVQAVVTALVLAAAVTSAATGNPKPNPDSTSTVSTTGNPG